MSETTEVNRAAFGQFLNQLRREKGWTQKDLAERLYVSDKAVSKWERGLSLPDVALLLPLAGALGVSVWMLGLAPTEMGQTCLVLGVGFGVIYGAYAFFWMAETLPRYYDENRIAQFAQGAMHIHIPGVYYNNRNWRYVLRAFRAWSMASMLLLPPSLAVAGQLDPHLGGKATVAAFAVYILSLFGCIVVPAKRHEKDEE